MLFVFIVPLRGAAASVNWQRTQWLCRQTICSMLACGPAVRVVLICNEIPENLPKDSRLSVESIATPIPGTKPEMMEDKAAKLRHGLSIARQLAPCWLMRADADDLVSRRLVEFAMSSSSAKHCVIETGWVWKQGNRTLVKQRNFHRICGTSLASRISATDFPDPDLADTDHWMWKGHHLVVDHLRELRAPIVSLPFPAVIYRVRHGENSSQDAWSAGRSRRRDLRRLIFTRPFTAKLKHEFGLETRGADIA